jgi:hypothetical protein
MGYNCSVKHIKTYLTVYQFVTYQHIGNLLISSEIFVRDFPDEVCM